MKKLTTLIQLALLCASCSQQGDSTTLHGLFTSERELTATEQIVINTQLANPLRGAYTGVTCHTHRSHTAVSPVWPPAGQCSRLSWLAASGPKRTKRFTPPTCWGWYDTPPTSPCGSKSKASPWHHSDITLGWWEGDKSYVIQKNKGCSNKPPTLFY